MPIKPCFRALGEDLESRLADVEYRTLAEYHRDRIATGFTEQTRLRADQESVGGFLVGFLAVVANFVRSGSIEQETTLPALGGVYLLGASVPAALDDGADDFVANLAAVVAAEIPGLRPAALRGAERLVRKAFAGTPDVAISRRSLSGFALGVLYARPYLRRDVIGPEVLIAAVSVLADGLPGPE